MIEMVDKGRENDQKEKAREKALAVKDNETRNEKWPNNLQEEICLGFDESYQNSPDKDGIGCKLSES